MLPVIIGLLLAIPIAAASSSHRIGANLRSRGFLLIPEERSPPTILARANALASAEWTIDQPNVLQRLCQDTRLLDLHRDMLPAREERKRGSVDVDVVVAMAKLDDVETLEEAVEALTPAERFAALSDRRALEQLLRKFGRSGGGAPVPEA